MPFQPAFAWKQPIDNHAPEGNTFGLNESKTQLYVDVDFVDELEAIETILGYPQGINAQTGLIQRILPASHPKFFWHYCTRENLKAYQYNAKAAGRDGSTFAGYSKSRIVCDFMTVPYDILPNSQTQYEWQRFVERTSLPSLENVVLPRGQFVFLPDANNPARNTPFNQGKILRLPKQNFVWTHHQLPNAWLMRDNYATMGLNFLNGLGTTNQFWFPSLIAGQTDVNNPAPGTTGYPPGTLLLLNIVPKPHVAPCSPQDVGIQTIGACPRIWSAEFHFLFVNPKTEPGYPYRGHALFPAKKVNPDGTIAMSDNFYLATSTGTADGVFLYPSYDFNLLFNQAT